MTQYRSAVEICCRFEWMNELKQMNEATVQSMHSKWCAFYLKPMLRSLPKPYNNVWNRWKVDAFAMGPHFMKNDLMPFVLTFHLLIVTAIVQFVFGANIGIEMIMKLLLKWRIKMDFMAYSKFYEHE